MQLAFGYLIILIVIGFKFFFAHVIWHWFKQHTERSNDQKPQGATATEDNNVSSVSRQYKEIRQSIGASVTTSQQQLGQNHG